MRPDSPRDFGAIQIIYLLTYLPLRVNLPNRRVAVRLLEDSQINRMGVVKQAVYHQVTFGYLIP